MSGKLTRVEVTESTNALLKQRLDAPHGTAVAAGTQTAGRGRMGRTFVSPPGGIYLSLLLRPTAPLEQYLHLTPVLAVAACDAVEECTGIRPGCKWVNDLYWQGKKLAGILTEVIGGVFIVGIGLNCDTAPADLPEVATSLAACGIHADRTALTEALRTHLTHAFDTALTEKIRWLDRYRENCITLGREVRTAQGTGTAADIDENGALLVQTESGIRAVSTGEVSEH